MSHAAEVPTPRELAREQTLAAITRLGRQQLDEVGAAGLSVRAIAKDLGVVSSALYRYVRSRDDLLTLLVVDAYDEVGDLADAAVAKRRRSDHAGRLRALARAVRAWALAEPARYALVFGSPVTGYAAPAERTVAPGTRVPFLLARIVAEAHAPDRPARPDSKADSEAGSAKDAHPLPRALEHDLHTVAQTADVLASPELVARTLQVWTSMFGAISFEVFGQFGATLTRPDQLFEHHVDHWVALLELER